MKTFHPVILFTAVMLISGWPLQGQTAKTAAEGSQPSAPQSLSLAEQGKCKEALLALRKGPPQPGNKEARMQAGVKIVECALGRLQTDTALEAIQLLNREFPHEPDVLYITTHAYSDLSTRASLELARTAPESYQAHELNAETLEMQGKWDEAASEYSMILKQQPELPGIHYRLGRIILSRPATATTAQDARKEFEAELKIDPKNAGAEYVLGELSRQTQQWDDAIEHFGRAAKLDANFADAFVGLGFSLNSVGRYAEAIPVLEIGVRLQPANPTAHYQLTLAYGKTGRKQDAEREMALFQQTSEQAMKQMHGEGQRPPAQPQ
jgi:tetratricopeptide (TPR) repeat protein